MWQVNATSGAVRAYYSWKVENPSDALHDVMVDAIFSLQMLQFTKNRLAARLHPDPPGGASAVSQTP